MGGRHGHPGGGAGMASARRYSEELGGVRRVGDSETPACLQAPSSAGGSASPPGHAGVRAAGWSAAPLRLIPLWVAPGCQHPTSTAHHHNRHHERAGVTFMRLAPSLA
eukprot:10097578-Alexandrium_andersonii.AAC.1